jgi:hypothetical protein
VILGYHLTDDGSPQCRAAGCNLGAARRGTASQMICFDRASCRVAIGQV